MKQRNTSLTMEEFLQKSQKVHGNRYDYSKVAYKSRNTKIIIICPFHKEFLQTPGCHFRGRGCPMCAGNIVSNTEDFIRKAKLVHGNRFNYDKVIYVSALLKVVINCSIHGDFSQSPHQHLKGNKCPECAQIEKHINNGFKWKSYTFPNGKVEQVQGYEPLTISYLLLSISSSNIILNRKEKPIIFYEWSGSTHRYFPDCYLPQFNTIVETKSSYTWGFQKEQNFAKITGSLQNGYNIRFIIWNRDKSLASDITYTLKSKS